MVTADDQNSDFVVNAADQKVGREPPQMRSPAEEKSLPQQIRHGTADKPTARRQVVNNSARTALIAGSAGSEFQPDRCGRLERELKEGDRLSKQTVVHTVRNS
jgi:hypothetical protein